MSSRFFEHDISFITARILITLDDSNNSIGTGFFCNIELPEVDGRSLILLISNKHVFVNQKAKLTVILNKKDEDNNPLFGDTYTYEIDDISSFYYEHPDEHVDLACINVSSLDGQKVHYKNLSKDFLEEIDYTQTPPGHGVIFVGYPCNRFDVVNNLPLIRKGYISSLPSMDFNGKGQIVIDAQVFQGSSGSPVFASYDGNYKLLGVVSETMIRNSKLQTLPSSEIGYGVQEILGLGIVIKQKHVKELLAYTIESYQERLKNV